MHIKSIVAAATIALIAGVGSVSADESVVAGGAVNTGTLFALPAGVATPMSEAELDAVSGGWAWDTTEIINYSLIGTGPNVSRAASIGVGIDPAYLR